MFVQKSLKSFGLVTLTVFSLCFSAPQVNADPACDAVFMTAMKNKAWMEAQREIMIAQSIIAKPDSVFALGCFGYFLDSYKDTITGDDFFVSNGYPMAIVEQNLNQYLGDSFGHAYGGGHDPAVGAVNNYSDGCAVMLNLWNDARCSNLSMEKIQTLTEMPTEDAQIRGEFPVACESSAPLWEVPLRLFAEKLPDLSVGAGFDDMKLFWDVTAPLSQTLSGACWPGIPTGVVFKTGGTTLNEVACPNPGCAPNAAAVCVPTPEAIGG